MYLDYSRIKPGQMDAPTLRLRTMAGLELGVIPYAYDVKFTINYSELSTMEFTVPYMVNGQINPLYGALTSFKEVYTDELGVYILNAPRKDGDGINETKTITGYSLEYRFKKKNLFLEEGTYNFWSPAAPADTILGRILELDPSWGVGYVSPRLIGCYRTFDQYDASALDFCYGDAMEKYRCAVVFDTYKRTINAYDAGEDAGTLPIYLSYGNLLESTKSDEITDELVTKLHVYGADGLNIREVNPTGSDYLIDLGYFISNGDLDIIPDGSTATLAERVREWEAGVESVRPYYTGLTAARASLTAKKLLLEADLTELRGQLEGLEIQQSVIIQSMSLETTDEGRAARQAELDEINSQIDEKREQISAQEEKIAQVQEELDGYAEEIRRITGTVSYTAFFTGEEQKMLSGYIHEESVEEETFVASDVANDTSGTVSAVDGEATVSESNILKLCLDDRGKVIYTIAGGKISLASPTVEAEIIRGTLDMDSDEGILTVSLGKTELDGQIYESGMLTVNGSFTGVSGDIAATEQNGVTEERGTWLTFTADSAEAFFTVNVTDFQRYSVAAELYDYGRSLLEDKAWPVYEFSVDSGNFLYHESFEPFKNALELGKGIHLNMGSDGHIVARLIGLELDFNDIGSVALTFSDRYRLKNGAETLADVLRSSAATSRSFDAGKYIYNRWAEKSTAVSDYMKGNLDAAVQTILGAANQSVWIDGAGLHIGSGKDQIRLVDNMIAMTDDGWATAKVGVGRFATPETGEVWGINTELLAGKLIIGNNLVLQNPTDDGVMQFAVDASGAWLYNATFLLQSESGKIMLDPRYGIAAGTEQIYTTEGTTVTPAFIDEKEDLILDDDGFPENANFYIDLRDGSVYLRGAVYAISGKFGGVVQAQDFLDADGNSMLSPSGKFVEKYLDLDGVYTEIDRVDDGLRLLVQDEITGAYSDIDMKFDSLTLEVIQDGQGASIVLKAGDREIGRRGYVKIGSNLDVSGQLSAEALYAAQGDIADLTVDKLSTSRRIILHLAQDTSDDNFVRIRDRYIEFVTGSTDGSEIQAYSPTGSPLYWEGDVSNARLMNGGWPYDENGDRIFTTTEPTQWPVMVYRYVEGVKRSIGFEELDGVYTPVDIFGAGGSDGVRRRGRLVKSMNGLDLTYTTSGNAEIGIHARDDGFMDLYGIRKTAALDFSNWDNGFFSELVDGMGMAYSYKVEFDSQKRPVKITDEDDHVTVITW